MDSPPAYKPIFTFSSGGAVSKAIEQLSGSEVLKVGEFRISQYTDDSLLISRDDGESMEVNLDTLTEFWDENY